MADPHPKSPEWRVIEHALVRGFLSPEQLDQARAVAGEPPGQEDAALLRVIVRKFTAPEHVDLLRAYYEEQKEVFKREAAEAEIEVLSISDILVRPVLEIDPDSGRFRSIPMEVAIAESGSGSGPIEAAPAPVKKWESVGEPKRAVPAWDEEVDPSDVPIMVPDDFHTPQPQPAAKPKPKPKKTSGRVKKTARTSHPSTHAPGSSGDSKAPSMVLVVGAVVLAVTTLGSALYLLLG